MSDSSEPVQIEIEDENETKDENEIKDSDEKTTTVEPKLKIARKKVDELTEQIKNAGYEVVSGPRTTGDGYYESCIVAIEGNQIELTV